MKPKRLGKIIVLLVIVLFGFSFGILINYIRISDFGKDTAEFELNYGTSYNYLPYFGTNFDASNITYEMWYEGTLHHTGVSDAFGLISEPYYGTTSDYQLRIVLDTGTIIVDGINFATTPIIELQTSKRLEGTVMWAGVPFANEDIDLLYYNLQTDTWDIVDIITTDALGYFVIEDPSDPLLDMGMLVSGMYKLDFCDQFYITQFIQSYSAIFDVIPTILLISSLGILLIFRIKKIPNNLTKNCFNKTYKKLKNKMITRKLVIQNTEIQK